MVINSLSLASINKVSPYKVKQVVDDGTFSFVTDNNVEIFVGFEQDDILRVGTIYQLSISNPKGRRSPRDLKVRETILLIVEEFFKQNQSALLYICATGDGLQKTRNRLFQYWFNIYQESDEYFFLPMTVFDVEGNDNYVGLIIRYDNPQFKVYVREFTNTVNLLNTKP